MTNCSLCSLEVPTEDIAEHEFKVCEANTQKCWSCSLNFHPVKGETHDCIKYLQEFYKMKLKLKHQQIEYYEKEIQQKDVLKQAMEEVPLRKLFINNQLKEDMFFFDVVTSDWNAKKTTQENFIFNSNLGIAVVDAHTVFLLGGAEAHRPMGNAGANPNKGSKKVFKLKFPDMEIERMRDYWIERFAFGVTVVRGEIIIAGGSISDTKQTESVENYVMKHDMWSFLPSLLLARFNPSLCSFEKRFIYAIGGGFYDEITQRNDVTNLIERLDFEKRQSWERVKIRNGSILPDACQFASIQNNETQILILGGWIKNGSYSSNIFTLNFNHQNNSEGKLEKLRFNLQHGDRFFYNEIVQYKAQNTDVIFVLGREHVHKINLQKETSELIGEGYSKLF